MPEPERIGQIELLRYMVESSARRSAMSGDRSCMNSERTLSALIHVALALMTLGFAVDRYQLVPRHAAWFGQLIPHTLTSWTGAALVTVGVLLALSGGLRYLQATARWRRDAGLQLQPSLLLPPLFALLIGVSGGLLLALLFAGLA